MSGIHPLIAKLRDHLDESQLIPFSASVLVGYSGGADSTFLVYALHVLGYKIVAGHLHHGIREEADEEMARCRQFCQEIGVPFESGRADVPLFAREGKMGLEEAGRMARYDFLNRAALRLNTELVATAHTLDDHVETVILNLIRGAGLSGISGIPALRGNIVRPMLHISREETQAFCREMKFWHHSDPANTDPAFARSRIRMSVVPELKRIQPNLYDSVSRLAAIAASEDAYLDRLAAAALEQAEAVRRPDLRFLTDSNEAPFHRKVLAGYPAPLLRRCVRLAARVVGGTLDFAQTLSVEAGIRSDQSGSTTAKGGKVCIEWNRKEVVFRTLLADSEEVVPISEFGIAKSKAANWVVEARECHFADCDLPRRSLRAVVSKKQVKRHLYCRTAKPGDAMIPLNMKGSKKVSDMFREAGLSVNARKLLPMVCDGEGIIWIPGVGLADRVKITSDCDAALELTLRPQA